MIRGLSSRVSKLEARNRPPVRVCSNVVEIDAVTRKPIGPLPPKGTRIMVVPNFGDAWSSRLQEQQRELIASANVEQPQTQTQEDETE